MSSYFSFRRLVITLFKTSTMTSNNLLARTAKKLLVCSKTSINFQRKQSLWTVGNIVNSPHKDIDIPKRTIPEHIWENLERWADKTAVICGITNRQYSYHQLYKYSRNFAAKLRSELKVRDDDVVCVMMSNSPEYPLVLLGALEAGAAVTTVNPTYTPHEVQRQIAHSSAKILVGEPETIPILKEALFLAKLDLPIITVQGSHNNIPSGTTSFEELTLFDIEDHDILKEVDRKSEDLALLPYSSGTTGLPKGVELIHKNIVANCVQQDVDTMRHYNETTKNNQDIVLDVLPLYHSYGISVLLLHKLSIGAKIVTLPKFQPNTFINALKQHPISLMYTAPPLVLFLGSHAGVTKEHLTSVKTIASGGAPLPKNDIIKLLAKVKHNCDFLNLYGMTECAPLATGMLPGSKNYTSVGFGLSNMNFRIVDTNMQSLGVNEVGELLIRGPNVMKGYRNDPEATKETIIEGGWLRSGDLATIDKDGVVTITDRLKELIKVKGHQVPPAELESVLKEIPDIFDVAVVGIPDSKTGEAPKAFIVLKGHKIDPEEIKSFVNKRVAAYKRVKEIMFIDELPRNPSGKILRRVLKEKYC